MARIKLEGMKIGRLQVYDYVPNKPHGMYICQCECGKLVTVAGLHLRSGHTQSCGCFKRDRTSQIKGTHRFTGSTEYVVWRNMHSRCYNPRNKRYARYGARGIKVCERWHDFENFLADMGAPPWQHTIGRRDNDGDYEKSNCRWETATEQGNNTCANVRIEFEGRTHTLTEWARERGIKLGTLWKRHKLGWTPERMLTETVQVGRRAAA